MTAEQDNPSGVRTDRPIRKLREDKLGRQGFARSIAAQIRNAPRGESFVMGLVGPWGSGKTSILNMVEDDLASDQNLLFLSFNPWLFSGHQQLVAHFFHEIAAQLRDEGGQELRDIWRGFEGYSRLLRPLRPVPGANNESHGETREPSVRRQRRELENALENTQYRLVIVIDDLDRLEDEEIQDVMRLVRLVADFPNTFYLLSYDQKRVEDALGGAGGAERGRAYLEKIVQIMHHVPELRPSDLTTILSSSLDAFLAKTHHLPAGNDYLLNVFYQGIRPLFQGMRDVYRYMNALEPTFKQIGDEIVSADILALEALRVLEPAVFMGIVDQIELVTGVQNPWLGAASRDEQQKQNASRDALFAIAGTRAPIIARLMTLLFPATRGHYGADSQGRWRKERRVAHPDVLRVYVERVLPTGALPTRTVQKFIDKQHEEQALMLHVESMSPTELEQQLQRLADYEEDIRPENAEVVIKVLLDQLPRLSGRRTTMYEIGPDTRLRWIIMGLLRKLDRSACLGIVERQLPRVKTLSLRGELLSIVNGNDEHRLINKIDLPLCQYRVRQRSLRI